MHGMKTRARRRPLVVLLLLLLALLAGGAAPHAAAHPAPSVIHDFVVTLNKDSAQIWVRFMISPPLVPQIMRTIDPAGPAEPAAAAQQAWIGHYVAGLDVSVDGQPRPLTLVRASDLSEANFLVSMRQAVSLTLMLSYDLGPAEEHTFRLTDHSNYVGYDEYYISYADSPGIIVTTNQTVDANGFERRIRLFERDV